MKIAAVDGEDFLTLDHVSFDLDDQGLVLVQGENLDDSAATSNGAGKSSLMDLVSWVLWGTTARGSSGDAVIRDGTSKASGFVNLFDETTGKIWTVSRSRRKGKGTLTVNDGKSDLTLGTEKLTQALIESIVGCTEEVFNASVYMGQENLVDLPRMTDRQLKTIVEEAAGVVVLERAYERARSHWNVAVTDHAAHCKKLDSIERELAVHTALVDREKIAVSDFDARRTDKIKNIEGSFTVLRASKAAVEANISPSIIQITAHEITVLQADLMGFDAERARESELNDALSKAKSVVASKQAVLKGAVSAVLSCKQALEDVTNAIGTSCGDCGTIMTEEHVCTARDNANKRLTRAASTLRAQQGEHVSAVSLAEDAQTALSAFRSAMRDPSKLAAELKTQRERLDAQNQFVRERDRIQNEMDKLSAEALAALGESNPHKSEVLKLETHQIWLQVQVNDVRARIKVAEERVAHTLQASQVFGPAGVRAHILDTVTPYLNERTSEYLSMLSDGVITANWTTLVRNAKGELREKFSIEVAHSAGSRGFNELSGGEKRKVRLACVLALQDLVASRATKPFGLFVADEIDHALDDAGLERLTTVLQAKAAVTGTVIVISHNAMDSYIPKVWQITKKDGKSSLAV